MCLSHRRKGRRSPVTGTKIHNVVILHRESVYFQWKRLWRKCYARKRKFKYAFRKKRHAKLVFQTNCRKRITRFPKKKDFMKLCWTKLIYCYERGYIYSLCLSPFLAQLGRLCKVIYVYLFIKTVRLYRSTYYLTSQSGRHHLYYFGYKQLDFKKKYSACLCFIFKKYIWINIQMFVYVLK